MSSAVKTFRTKKEALCYRISKMLPVFLEKNEDLIYGPYKMCKVVEKAACEDGNWQIANFNKRVDKLKDENYYYKDGLDYILANLDTAALHILERTDEKLEKNLGIFGVPVNIPSADDLTEVLINDKASNNVEYFENVLKVTALEMLANNRAEVAAISKRYTVALTNPESDSSNLVWNNFQTAMEKDLELTKSINLSKDKRGDLEARISYLIGNTGGVLGMGLGAVTNKDEIEALEKEVADADLALYVLQKSRVVLNNEYPVTRLVKGDKGVELSRENALVKVVNACNNSSNTFDKMEESIISGDMPLHRMDFIVQKALDSEKISPANKSAYSVDVQAWIKSKEREKFWLNILGIVIPLGLAAACFIPGIGVGAIIALGAIGAGVGGTMSAFELERAADLNLAANASEVGSEKFVEVEEARAAYVWAIVGMALSVADAFLAGRAVKSLVAVSKGLRGFKGSSQILKLLDEKTIIKLGKLKADEIAKVLKVADSPDEIAKILNNISDTKSFRKITKMDFSNLNGADVAVLKGYPTPPKGYMWRKAGDDAVIVNKSGNQGEVMVFNKDNMTFYNKNTHKFVASGDYLDDLAEYRKQFPKEHPIHWEVWNNYPGTKFENHHWINQAQLTGQNRHPLFDELLETMIESDLKKKLIDADWNIDKIPHRGGHSGDYYVRVREYLDRVEMLLDKDMEIDEIIVLMEKMSNKVKNDVKNGFSLYSN